MSRFAADPRWLIYLPPTMSPCETSREGAFLEHPREAFEYFRTSGVGRVICEEKHMGSRAVAIVCKDHDVAARFASAPPRRRSASSTPEPAARSSTTPKPSRPSWPGSAMPPPPPASSTNSLPTGSASTAAHALVRQGRHSSPTNTPSSARPQAALSAATDALAQAAARPPSSPSSRILAASRTGREVCRRLSPLLLGCEVARRLPPRALPPARRREPCLHPQRPLLAHAGARQPRRKRRSIFMATPSRSSTSPTRRAKTPRRSGGSNSPPAAARAWS